MSFYKIYLLLLIFILSSSFCFSQNTYVPDDNFEQALIDLGYDFGPLDDYVPTANIDYITSLNVQELNIADLTGIEDFIALISLDCSRNKLTTIDLSKNINIEVLNCNENQLNNLDITNNSNLIHLNCSLNLLESIDIAHNNKLMFFSCRSNFLENLDVAKNVYLENLDFSINEIINIDINQNVLLNSLICHDNKLTDLDVSKLTKLKILACFYNELTKLDVTKNPLLIDLFCHTNQVSYLDMSQNPNLKRFECEGNQLVTLDLRSGNNVNITRYNSLNNSNLSCVFVDDVDYSTTNWLYVDSHSTFMEVESECGETDITDFIIPKFFTPNNDGENDYWEITDATNLIESINIHDRFGKILTIISSNSQGWDGYYNGVAMPSTDYWFVIQLVSGEEIKGNFALVR